ncbi:MAG TPA: peptidylprolyl isomerase [Vicinamibacterales bacterium]|nr:peptidylprolyl isomerase [Vicinamibacterales bacterium]
MNRVLTALALIGTLAVSASSFAQTGKPSLMNPASLNEQAPATYKVKFDTSAGEFIVTVTRAWAPIGADRFYNLVKNGFYDGQRFFRVVPNFMVQFGINGDPDIQRNWMNANLKDDPAGVKSNARGYITFANRGPNSRSTQVFINYKSNAFLDKTFMPFGEVTVGMSAVDKINAEYREEPDQNQIQNNGNRYLTKAFPRLDFIKKATIEPAAAPPAKK